MLGYSYQLYFDFAGYSNMAIGLGYLFGIHIPQNFNSPYKADGIADFWRRWHISLSSCLRDYLYIPLGGSRGTAWAVNRNLMTTMLLGGLWHGPSWTYAAWGGYHGLLLCAHRALGEANWNRLPALMRRGMTFIAVVVGWVFFRAKDFTMAGTLLRTMFTPQLRGEMLCFGSLAGLLVIASLLAHVGLNTHEIGHEWHPRAAFAWACVFAISLTKIYLGGASPFLYFQF